jgi:arylsulfatase A-like enzyme
MNEQLNLVLITIDSLRADHLSCLGYNKQKTPNIDALARKGALFTQAFSNGGGSVTSFPSIMTSTYPLMNPNSNAENDLFWIKLSDKWTTIAEVLRSNGSSTAAFKNRKGDISSIFGYDRGFDLFEPFGWVNESLFTKLGHKISFLRGNKYQRANFINQKATSWLERKAKNFFLWLHYMDVHLPYNPPNLSVIKRLYAVRLAEKLENSAKELSRKDIELLTTLYDREIKSLDNKIGMLLTEMDEMGISVENTFFVLMSDHGDQHMEHGECGHGRLYDEVLHVPLIICGPNIERDTIVEEQISLLDVAPTIVDLLGIAPVRAFQGKSLLPLIMGEKESRICSYVISEEIGANYSIRTKNWKYIRNDRTNTHELYNLREDSKEKSNLVNEYPKKVKEYSTILSQHKIMEEKIGKTLFEERNSFLTKEREFLGIYPKKDKAFQSKVLGTSRDV